MSIVVEVIAEYLLSNRRLVVPAFGAFVVKESGEKAFSDLLRTDDGVLASLLRDKGLSEMEAAVTIDRFIFEVRHELEEYGYCRLGDIGTLRVEPGTGVLRLNPPVYGEALPKNSAPYIPAPITDEEEDVATVEEPIEENEPEKPQIEQKEQPKRQPKRKVQKSRKGVDWIIVLAVVALVVALAVLAYGLYVSTLGYVDTSADEAAVSELQVLPNNSLEKE